MKCRIRNRIRSWLFLLLAFCVLARTGATAYAASGEQTALVPVDIAADELLAAAAIFPGCGTSQTETVTFAEYYALLGTLIAKIYPDDDARPAAWDAKYPAARVSTEGIARINAMYLLYAAAYDVLGGVYAAPREDRWPADFSLNYWDVNDALGADVWDEIWVPKYDEDGNKVPIAGTEWFETDHVVLKQDWFPDQNDFAAFDSNTGSTFSKTARAYFYSFAQSARSGATLFDYDQTADSMRVGAALTQREALLSVYRLYCVPDLVTMPAADTMVSVSSDAALRYNTALITPALLTRAAYLPTPSSTSLPLYTGMTYTDEMLKTCAVRTAAQMGMNYLRINLSCKEFFNIGDEVTGASQMTTRTIQVDGTPYDFPVLADPDATAVTEVDLHYLTMLDEVIAAALQYGVHLSVQFSDYPSHIQWILPGGFTAADYDFYWNEAKQAQTLAMWELLAERYAGIPSSVLSFIPNHEPGNANHSLPYDLPMPSDTQIEAYEVQAIDAIRVVDPDRFLLYEDKYNHMDDFLGDRDLAQVNVYGVEFGVWNYGSDADSSGGYFPTWPYYCIPAMLNKTNTDLTVDGFLPADTTFEITANLSDLRGVCVTGEKNGSLYTAGDDVLGKNVNGHVIRFTLAQAETKLTISVTPDPDPAVYWSRLECRRLLLTLPGEYQSTRWYTDGGYHTGHETDDDRYLVTNSQLEIKISTAGSLTADADFNSLASPQRRYDYDRAWLLDTDDTHADVTIVAPAAGSTACTYTTRFGHSAATLQKTASYYAAERSAIGRGGMIFEFSCNRYNTDSEIIRYYDDMLQAFEDNDIGWGLFYPENLLGGTYAGAQMHIWNGIMVNTAMLEMLQTHMAARPVLYAEIPALACRVSSTAIAHTVTAQISSPVDTAAQCHVIAAAYGDDGQMLCAATESLTLGGYGKSTVALTLQAGAETAKIKVFYLCGAQIPIATVELPVTA